MDLHPLFPHVNGARLSFKDLSMSGAAWRPPAAAGDAERGEGAAGAEGSSVTMDELRLQSLTIEARWRPGTAAAAGTQAWALAPVAGLAGELRIAVTDAAWLFDADVQLPIESGRIDFNRATVSHVGPDSSMGLSRMGIYVDAPNGRQYLALLAAGHVDGAHFEQRGALLASRVTDRGALALLPLVQAFLSGARPMQPAAGAAAMLARTRVDARLRLADGRLGLDGAAMVLTGAASGRNQLQLLSTSGGGLLLRWPELSAEQLQWPLPAPGGAGAGRGTAAALQGSLSVELRRDGDGSFGVTLQAPELVLRQISLRPPARVPAMAAERRVPGSGSEVALGAGGHRR